MPILPLTPIVSTTQICCVQAMTQLEAVSNSSGGIIMPTATTRDAPSDFYALLGKLRQVEAERERLVQAVLQAAPPELLPRLSYLPCSTNTAQSLEPKPVAMAPPPPDSIFASPGSPFLDSGMAGFEDMTIQGYGVQSTGGEAFDIMSEWPLLPASISGEAVQSHCADLSFPCSDSTSAYGTSNRSISPHHLFLSPFETTLGAFDTASGDFDYSSAASSWAAPSSFPSSQSNVDFCDNIDWTDSSRVAAFLASCDTPTFTSTSAPTAPIDFALLPSMAGRERRLSRSELRFTPISRPAMSTSGMSAFSSPNTSPALLPVMSDIPDEMAELSLFGSSSSSSMSRKSSSASSRKGTGKAKAGEGLARKGSGKARGVTEFNYNSDLVFPLNEEHVFVVHSQPQKESGGPEVTERGILRLHLEAAPSSSALYRCTVLGEPYTERHFAERGDYTFGDEKGGQWLVSFTGYATRISPLSSSSPFSLSQTQNQVHTFIHFPPGSFVTSDLHPIGSIGWWRVQACDAKQPHDGFPGSGAWTARYDAEPTKRRPARILDHVAHCRQRKIEGDRFALGKLARAMIAATPTGSTKSLG